MDEQIKQAIREILADGPCPTSMALLIAMRQKFPHQLPESYPVALQLVIKLRDQVQSEATR